LKPPVAISLSARVAGRVGESSTPIRPLSAKTGREARIEGNEKGVQLPVANAFSKTVPRSANPCSVGVWLPSL